MTLNVFKYPQLIILVLVQMLENIKIMLFAVMATEKYGLMSNIMNWIKLILMKMLLTHI